jgi:alcohol dehydrogenase YqhD (iron-dependent ADH family)
VGLAIITRRWMEHRLSDKTVSKYVQYGVYVFGIDENQPAMDIAHQAIDKTKEFLFDTLGLKSSLSELGIGDEHIPTMARKACRGGVLPGFVPLNQQDIETIFRNCL